MTHVEVAAAIGLIAGLWVAAWRAHGQALPGARAVAFAGGLAALGAAMLGPLHVLAERPLIAPHMVQHLLLTLVVPPCLLAGTPAFMAEPLLAPLLRRPRLARLAWRLTRPVPALAAHAVALVGWHLPVAYGLALDSHAWHLAQHASLTATATLAWWPVLGPARQLPRLHYGAQLLYIFVLGVPMTVVAAMITGAEQLLYPSAAPDPLADQRLGGVIMWVPAGIVPLATFSAVFFRWVAAEWDDPAPELPGAAPAPGPPGR
jgi:putative membrane protein